MTTITVTYTDDEVDKFKRTLFADEAWAALKIIDRILMENYNTEQDHHQTLGAVRDVLADVLWRVE